EAILGQTVDIDSVMARPGVARLPAGLYEALWEPSVNRYAAQFTHPQHRTNMEVALEFQRRLVTAFHAAGVRLLAGTDAPVPGVLPGESLHDELRHFVDAGLSPCEALQTATIHVAQYLGRAGDFGEITPGARADLLLLDADPHIDLDALARPRATMLGGRWRGSDGPVDFSGG